MPKGNRITLKNEKKPVEKWCLPEHATQTIELLEFFKKFTREIELKVWDSVTHDDRSYTCWYVSFPDADTYVDEKGLRKLCIALHFNIINNKRRRDIDVFFRFMKVIKKSELDLIDWNLSTKNCEYVSFEKNKDKLENAMTIYLTKLRERFRNRSLGRFHNFVLSDTLED